jgi:hypothetical protein
VGEGSSALEGAEGARAGQIEKLPQKLLGQPRNVLGHAFDPEPRGEGSARLLLGIALHTGGVAAFSRFCATDLRIAGSDSKITARDGAGGFLHASCNDWVEEGSKPQRVRADGYN